MGRIVSKFFAACLGLSRGTDFLQGAVSPRHAVSGSENASAMDGTELDTPVATPSPIADAGQIIADRYRLVRKLGEGAMGAVFLAEHVHMRKRFALKLLLPEAMASPEIVARFEREAIAAGNIGHPGVCAATDFGQLADGSFFLVLEYVDGRSLRSVLGGGALAQARALDIARQILAALAAAHDKGVVHRDIKPENVMLAAAPTGHDVVKVLDFGIAKVDANTLGEGQGTNLTRMGAIYGTPAYMAPEQAMGRHIDQRVDLYAVGVMLHEMIAGTPPFDGDGIMILAAHVNQPPPPLTSPHGDVLSDDVRQFVARLLAKVADARPTDARTAIAELDAARATLVSFEYDGATNATVMGAASSVTVQTTAGTFARSTAAATFAGSSQRTVAGASPTPPPVATTVTLANNLQRARSGVLSRLAPLAARAGVGVGTLGIAIFSVTGLLLLLVIMAIARPSKTDDVEEDRPRKRTAPAAAVPSESPPVAAGPTPTTSASTSASKGGSGGGIKGLGRRIKGLF